jgi:hypothetical protein
MLLRNLSISLLSLAMASCATEEVVPDGEWQVNVTGLSTDCCEANDEDLCAGDLEGYQEGFAYQLFFDGSTTEIKVDGDRFATGITTGCNIEYSSSIWLEERDGGSLNWQIIGQAQYQGAAGGCSIENDLDWAGTEVLTVIQSDDPSAPLGCTYTMSVEGSFTGG